MEGSRIKQKYRLAFTLLGLHTLIHGPQSKHWAIFPPTQTTRPHHSFFFSNFTPDPRILFVSNARDAKHTTTRLRFAAGRAGPNHHPTHPPTHAPPRLRLRPPGDAGGGGCRARGRRASELLLGLESGGDERRGAVRGADGAGVRRGGPAGRGRARVAVPVRGGAAPPRLDLLLPPPLQRPLPLPPRAVSWGLDLAVVVVACCCLCLG